MIRQVITISIARTRGGRAILHALCLARGRNMRWHLGGIVRELFSANTRRSSSRSRNCDRLPGLALLISLLQGFSAVAVEPTTISAAASAGPAFSLLPIAQVDSTGVFLSQAAALNGLEPITVPVRLASAPPFGRSLVLSRDQVIAALQGVRPDLAQARWSGADSIRITRRARLLAEGEVRELLTAALQSQVVKDRGELELRLARPWTSVNVPDEPLTLRLLDVPTAGVSQHFIVRFELLTGDGPVGPWQAVLQAKVMRNILVASATTQRGQLIESSDVTVERRDVLVLREPLDEAALQRGPHEFLEPVQAGQPLLARVVRPRPVVQRGMLVDGLMLEGPLQISLKVEVLADGLPGQMVRVRNPKTKREFYAKVKNEQTVLINL